MPATRGAAWSWVGADTATIRAAATVLVDMPLIDMRGTLYRAVYEKYLHPATGNPEPLYYRGSLSGRRYTPRGGPAGLYLALDPATPVAELRNVVFTGDVITSVVEHDPVLTVSILATVTRVLDLTDSAVTRSLKLTKKLLRAHWEVEMDNALAGRGPMPATQLLADAAYVTGLITGIKYPSARTRFGKNLVVFPDRLNATRGDDLLVVDSTNRYAQHLP